MNILSANILAMHAKIASGQTQATKCERTVIYLPPHDDYVCQVCGSIASKKNWRVCSDSTCHGNTEKVIDL